MTFPQAGPAHACLAYRRAIPPRSPKPEAEAPPWPEAVGGELLWQTPRSMSATAMREDRGFHPCRRVQEALRSAGIEYEKVIAAHGSPLPFLRKGSRDELFEAIGTRKLPALRLPDGTVLVHSKPILSWVEEEEAEATHHLLARTRPRRPLEVTFPRDPRRGSLPKPHPAVRSGEPLDGGYHRRFATTRAPRR